MLSRFRSVLVDDFRRFQGEQTIELDVASPDFHVIIGSSGVGKTTLCSAIRLALFGERPRLSSTSDISWPVLDAAEDTPTATIRVDIDSGDTRYRVERTLTERGTPDNCDMAVSEPQVSQYHQGTWTAVDSPSGTLAHLAPPDAVSLVLVDAEMLAEAPAAGWHTFAERLLEAGAAYRSAPDGSTATPEALWEEFCPVLDGYVDEMGLSPQHELQPAATPFTFCTGGTHDEDDGTVPSISRGSEATQLALAMTLAAGDCAGVPQWFDCPLRCTDRTAAYRALDGLEAAATHRQIVLLAHTGRAPNGPDIERKAATVHELVTTDRWTTAVRRCE